MRNNSKKITRSVCTSTFTIRILTITEMVEIVLANYRKQIEKSAAIVCVFSVTCQLIVTIRSHQV